MKIVQLDDLLVKMAEMKYAAEFTIIEGIYDTHMAEVFVPGKILNGCDLETSDEGVVFFDCMAENEVLHLKYTVLTFGIGDVKPATADDIIWIENNWGAVQTCVDIREEGLFRTFNPFFDWEKKV